MKEIDFSKQILEYKEEGLLADEGKSVFVAPVGVRDFGIDK